MNIWKFASRWSDTGEWGSTILDIFVKNGVAFIYPDGHNLEEIEVGDLIAISDGHTIVAIGRATTRAGKICEMQGVHLSEADKRKVDGSYRDIKGVRIYLPSTAVLGHERGIYYAHTGRFCWVASSAVSESIIAAWNNAQTAATSPDFDIQAQRRTLSELLKDLDTRLYMIPVFQRPYAWGELELERFLGDLHSSYQKNKRMFIGTMQLSGKRCLSPRGQYFQEIIDGQQRLTTCALILKVLCVMAPENAGLRAFCRDFNWIESKVNSGQQQERLDAALHAESIDAPSEGGTNQYLDNCAYIKGFLTGISTEAVSENEDAGEEGLRPFTVDTFFRHMVEELLFVIIETEAGLSQTINIFNIINTTGLDLNGGDLFKVRAFEYLTDHKGQSADCFEEISGLYEAIDRNTTDLRRNYTNINEILGIYQKIIVGRNNISVAAARQATETFYERFFDSILGLKQWEHFTRILNAEKDASQPLIQLSEIERLIHIRHDFEVRWLTSDSFDFDTRLAFHLIAWSRYSAYWSLFLVVEFCYPEETKETKSAFVQALSRLFVVYSTIYAKQVYEIHGFVTELTQDMLVGDHGTPDGPLPLSEINAKIGNSTESMRPRFRQDIQGDLANYALPKNLICRLLESLEAEDPDKLDGIFDYGYDIEHIQSYHHEDHTLRADIWKTWGSLINSTGNLMLLESNLNRSIGNKAFTEKQKIYAGSKFSIAKKISEHSTVEWCQASAKEKLRDDTERLCGYLFNEATTDQK